MQILREFLNAFWLRPEVALIKTHEYLALKQLHVNEPSLDIGCGDGIFSFISSGGRFGLGFDMYQNVKGTDQFFKGVDVFDHFDENDFTIDIVQKPNEQITYGLDHKATLLAKASKLGLYKNTIHSDANESIPLKSNSISTVFCNILYILEEVDGLLNETHRILSDSGRFILQLPERRAEEAMVHHFYKNYGWEWAKLIDREKYAITYPSYHKHEREYWDELLSRAGFGIVEEVNGNLQAIHWSSVRSSPKDEFPQRLKRIYDELVLAIKKFKPDVVVVEDLFYATNVKTVIKLGQTRGITILAAINSGLPVAEYSPLEIKQSVVGYGRADKIQVQNMVTTLLQLKEKPDPFDASDALAAAICHIHNDGLQQKIKQAD